ncbi:CCA tRNA nucleotidyltransferase [Ovoidimarina sediminis]|uniref:CCA tRNA nucleotidyltransferase n=1 Tax=Ovoidimarina sediminis TaxID=3079856 RepID=UPI00290AD11B|nr:CCA tRNA nucleotidyltransferase [Rhodophyticola sp. MJ-SS7]MDU8944532.1 CCA tRNA nucleotidyltransferase [Rhodophyticola sp. MJ-SS7]
MTRVTGDWVKAPATQAVFDVIEGAGHRAWFVGGCVRDALAWRPVKDIDIATDATPEAVMALAEAAGLKAVPTGIDHGTVTIVSGEIPHEVTTLRRDVETDGRRAVVAFASEIAEDAARRDFTMNALYADRAGEVIDPTGEGVRDLQAGHIRFVGDAGTRIREDYLRILRYFRFLARFGSAGPEPDALAAISDHLAGIDTLSAERLGHEMRRLLEAPDPAPAVATMAQVGVLMRVLPGADSAPLAPLVHLEEALGVAPDWVRRLAALGGEDAAERLRLSRTDAKRLEIIRGAALEGAAPKAAGYYLGEAAALDALLLRGAFLGEPVAQTALDAAKRGAAAEFPLKAADLMDRFQGPALGAALKAREARWVASGFTLDRAALLKD